MKYMGSKRTMLRGSLGEVINRNMADKKAFYDLFTGSGAVAHFVAENFDVEVIASDLQHYASALAGGIITRTRELKFDEWGAEWIAAGITRAEKSISSVPAAKLQNQLSLDRLPILAKRARKLSSDSSTSFVRAYGGWYFSPWQALLLDSLRQEADPNKEWYNVAVSAVVQAASRCVAAPGHTAQPFKAETRSAPFLYESWNKDVIAQVTAIASELCTRCAKVVGRNTVADANIVAAQLKEGDVAFLDPPYSSVHYSRFYHVLESLAQNEIGEVTGAGRYPDPSKRPSSDYSIPTKSSAALEQLLTTIAESGATAIVTFPAGQASNRLSGTSIRELAASKFRVTEDRFRSRFSTLGGDQKHRMARQDTEELILTLAPH